MASALRPTVLRHACMTTPARRLLTTTARSSLIFRSPVLQQPKSRLLKSAFVKDSAPGAARVEAFHASVQRGILPPEPQKVQGTANDPAPVPDPHPTHGSYHWTFERLVSLALIPLTVAPFASGSLYPVMDATFCALLVVHSHIGFQAFIIDYIPTKRLPTIRKLFGWALRAGTLLVAYGLYEFETNDVGITEATKRIWQAGRAPAAEATS